MSWAGIKRKVAPGGIVDLARAEVELALCVIRTLRVRMYPNRTGPVLFCSDAGLRSPAGGPKVAA